MGFGDESKNRRVLVVDDDRVTRELLRGVLEKEGYEVHLVESAEAALERLQAETSFAIISDIHMFGMDGLELLRQVRRVNSDAFVILMTSFGSLQGAVEAIQQGAFDYISKPFSPEEVRRLLSRARLEKEAQRLAQPAKRPLENSEMAARTLIGKSPRMVLVYKALAKASMTGSNVLIVGESGTGKELVAKAIHDHSRRSQRQFVTVNCGALTETLLESELFGHIKGSFTGAIANKRGLFDEADGGTIFLDEIGDISPALQVKLLRVIQEGEFKPVGSTESRRVDTRVIAATHRDLESLVKEGKFREDLFYRLKVITLELPPLRARPEDIPELARHFLNRHVEKSGRPAARFSREAMSLLTSYSWPGNIRELEHAIERAFAMTSTSMLYPEDFPPELLKQDRIEEIIPSPETGTVEDMKSLEAMEKKHIVRILQEVNFNKSRAADILGIDRATLYRKAQRYGIRLAEEKTA